MAPGDCDVTGTPAHGPDLWAERGGTPPAGRAGVSWGHAPGGGLSFLSQLLSNRCLHL